MTDSAPEPPEKPTGEAATPAAGGPLYRRRALGVVLFALRFWPVFWLGCFSAIGAAQALYQADSLDRLSVHRHVEFIVVYSALFSALGVVPALVSATLMAILTDRQGTFGYVPAALTGGLVTSLLVLAFDHTMPVTEVLGVGGFGAALALIGRFAMARLGVLPSRWPKRHKS